MYVTFLIGNGFDLSCGLKSRYRQVYDEYVKTESTSELIKQFKRDISYSIDDWGDFEVAMANYMTEFFKERDFLICLRDFRSFLKEYLRREEKRFLKTTNDHALAVVLKEEMRRSVDNFYTGITHNLDNEIEKLSKEHPLGWDRYINYNYTSVFDHLISYIVPGVDVLHIHGKLDEHIVLGMDNEDQLSALYPITNKTRRGFIKLYFNQEYDGTRLERAQYYIESSDVICIYGMSLGKSDETWRRAIFDWLIKREDGHLFIYQYQYSKMKTDNIDERMDNEEDAKNDLMSQMNLSEEDAKKCFPRLHIPCGKDLFNIRDVILDYQAEKKTT